MVELFVSNNPENKHILEVSNRNAEKGVKYDQS